ncbi:MAG TPA: endonuclease/exonuclease/phosphatase family protein [Candidatus Paceibacterota bacterium]|nr:endonuclease/exonuclease/phosphatase family protein [Candidatus Paceibacterota bacterium]
MRIAVLNLQSGIGITKGFRHYLTSGWKYVLPHSPKPIAEAGRMLKGEGVDIALVTEIDDNGLRSGFVLQSEVLKEHSGLAQYESFPTRTVEHLMHEGNGIFTNHEILETHVYQLSAGLVPRVLGEVVMRIDGKRVHVFVAHLGLRNRYRTEQLKAIRDIVMVRKDPVILGGDFNERERGAFELLTEAGFAHLVALPNFPSWRPRHPLIVLFLSRHFAEPSAHVQETEPFSDHLSLIVETSLAR